MMMRRRISILSAQIVAEQLLLNIDESVGDLQPTGQMLVDSDYVSFIYLLEGQENYTYIVLPEQIWGVLHIAKNNQAPVSLVYKEERLALTNFYLELEYIIGNIQGNSNYGDEMEKKVDIYFS